MKYYAMRSHVRTNFEAISLCADKLYEEGCVTKEFKANCIEREKKFPTGLASALPAAMPHSESSGVLVDAVCVLILDTPVAFKRMDDDEQTIAVSMVFNLAITDPSCHMFLLQNLMKILYSKEEMIELAHADLHGVVDKMKLYLELET